MPDLRLTGSESSDSLRYRAGVPHKRYRGPAITLADRRENGVRSLSVKCGPCHHEAVMNMTHSASGSSSRVRPAHGLHRLRPRPPDTPAAPVTEGSRDLARRAAVVLAAM